METIDDVIDTVDKKHVEGVGGGFTLLCREKLLLSSSEDKRAKFTSILCELTYTIRG